ncbi:MBL fold metallo-hydrolase [Streptosporangium saharense]|uniref:MBL fold metallo-hydrolase n=1 Tax=Streptosporangium saharense TaxID=1706840 RepID=UPI0034410CFA
MMPDHHEASVLFVGTATTLIRYNGLTLLTDPNFLRRGQRAYLGYGLSSRRLTEPALDVGELPPLDGVVLSHLHGDHWDRVARAGLDRNVPIITTPHAARRLRRQGFGRAVGLTTWHDHELHRGDGSVRITALPAKHAAPAMGSMLEFSGADERVGLRLLISGDTLMDRSLSAIPRRFPEVDVAIAHLGGTKLLGLPKVTMDGEQGARWTRLIDPRIVLPVHHDDYPVFTSPLEDFLRHAELAGLADRVRPLRRGETYTLPVRPRPHA